MHGACLHRIAAPSATPHHRILNGAYTGVS